MGSGRWSPEDWGAHVASTASKPAAAIFRSHSHGMHADLDPSKITMRESCDSVANPCSTPIIVGIDVTGSMGVLATVLVKEKLGTLVEEIYNPDRMPVRDPHVMLMAIGDAWCDRAPLQATQFEADTTLIKQLENFYVEGGGGGNRYESYNLPWYFAATKTKCDSMIKRNKKGYLFTAGDEEPPPVLLASHVKQFLGGGCEDNIPTKDLLTMVSQSWEVYHLCVAEGNHYRSCGPQVKEQWQELLGERAIELTDHTKLSEVIVSLIQANEGMDPAKVAASWSGDTALVVAHAVAGLTKTAGSASGGVARF